jgi:hypothetical protein
VCRDGFGDRVAQQPKSRGVGKARRRPHGVGEQEHQLPVTPGDGGEAERGYTRVDPEHAGIEHLFSLWDGRDGVKHLWDTDMERVRRRGYSA